MCRPLVIALLASALLNVRNRCTVLCSGDLLWMGLTHLITVMVSASKLLASQISSQWSLFSGSIPSRRLKAIKLCTLEQNMTLGPILLHSLLQFSCDIIHVVVSSVSISMSAPLLRSLLIEHILLFVIPKSFKLLLSSFLS